MTTAATWVKDLDSYTPNREDRVKALEIIAEIDTSANAMVASLDKADETFPDDIDELKIIEARLEEVLMKVTMHMSDILAK